jgi:hypothetical protein
MKPILPGALLVAALALAAGLPHNAPAQTQGQAIAQAYEAARADAYRNLLESISGLSISGGTTVRNMAAESSEVRARLEEFIWGAEILEESLEGDGVAKVVLEVDLGRLSRLLGEEVGDGVTKIRMEGHGAPPSAVATGSGAASAVEPLVLGSPEAWNREPEGVQELNSVVTVVGVAAQDNRRARSAAQARLMAERAATQDAYRKLLEYIYGLSISSTTTVRDMVLDSDRVDSQLSGFVRGARVEGVEHQPDGVTEVTVSIDLSGLREIIR